MDDTGEFIDLRQRLRQRLARITLEELLTNRLGFGLTTASPLQRAVCRISDGLDVEGSPVLLNALGYAYKGLPAPPKEVFLLSGIRGAKSLIAACKAVKMALTCKIDHLGPGEVPRVSIVSLTKDLAQVVFAHLVGRITASPWLRGFMVGKPGVDSIELLHPTGRIVEIKVVAGARAGASLVARWSGGCIFDEFPRMIGSEDGVVNWEDSRDAVLLRLVEGAQLLHIGSPWAPFGPAYTAFSTYYGERDISANDDTVLFKAPAYDMNPVYWTPARVEAAKKHPDAYRTVVLAEFSTHEEAFIPSDCVTFACSLRAEGEPRALHAKYYAAMDPATRGNGWTLVIGAREGDLRKIAFAKEWRGSRDTPLDTKETMGEVANICARYGVKHVDTDQWGGDFLADIARGFGITLQLVDLNEDDKFSAYSSMKTMVLECQAQFPNVGNLKSDLMRLKKRVTATSSRVTLPHTSDGRHCDFAPSIMLVLGRHLRDIVVPKVVTEEDRILAAVERRYTRGKSFAY